MRSLMLIVAAAAVAAGGCAGDAARVNALGPAMAEAWPLVRESAELGVRARTNPVAAAALGVHHWDAEPEGPADQRRQTIEKFEEAVNTFRRQR